MLPFVEVASDTLFLCAVTKGGKSINGRTQTPPLERLWQLPPKMKRLLTSVCMYFLLSIKLLSLQFLADIKSVSHLTITCLLYTSDAADES